MPPSESLRFSHDSGSLIPPWAFWSRNLPRFLFLSQKTPGFEVPEDPPHGGGRSSETLSPEEDGELPLPQEGEFLPESLNSLQASGSTGTFGSSWASRPILLGFGVFRGSAFPSTERRLRAMPIFRR